MTTPSGNQCRRCCTAPVQTLYEGPIRGGGASSLLEGIYHVLECTGCSLVWLDPFPPDLEHYYQSSTYWTEHHGEQVNVSRLRAKLDHEQMIWLQKIGSAALRGKTVADFGCGSGIFFDFIKGVASRCVGIDLAQDFAAHFRESGYEFRSYNDASDTNWADVVVSFDTLEHVPAPWEFLQRVANVLKPGGRLYLGVPNQKDFLKELIPEYVPFFYHKSHLWYFHQNSLSKLVCEAGLSVVKCHSVHKYDLNNMITWARDRKPSGKVGSNVFDAFTNRTFIENIERQGVGSHILIIAEKAPSDSL